MKALNRAAILSRLAERLEKKGSWCGETHLQKAVFFLQELLSVPLGFRFLLYKHGPFSFDLRDYLTSMRADGLLELRLREDPYGPSLLATRQSKELWKRFPLTLSKYERHIEFTAKKLGPKSATDLEKLATALYVTHKKPQDGIEERGKHLTSLKPHVPLAEAKLAVEAVDKLIGESKAILQA